MADKNYGKKAKKGMKSHAKRRRSALDMARGAVMGGAAKKKKKAKAKKKSR